MDLTILECKRFVARSGKPVSRRINHYELDFYVGGKRKIEVDGRKSEIRLYSRCIQTERCVGARRG